MTIKLIKQLNKILISLTNEEARLKKDLAKIDYDIVKLRNKINAIQYERERK